MKSLVQAAVALAFGALVAAPAQAARLPPGSYLQSCRNAYVDSSSGKPKVFAECPDRQGNWHHSGMQFMKCSGDIANQNGELVCVNPGGSGARPNAAGLPGGTWQQSCRDPQINGSMLTATCLRGSGGSSFSSLDIRACSGGPVGNQNGQLYCEAAAGQGNTGGGQATTGGGQDNAGGGQGSTGGEQVDTGGGQATTDGGQGNAGAPGGGANIDAGDAGLPAGSWQRSCRNSHLSESVLTANCQRRDGAYHYSALDLTSCDGGPVGTDNGRLVCETAGQSGGNAPPGNAGNDTGNADAGGGAVLPAGSWQQTCNNPRIDGSVLTASCQRRDGGSRFSALDLRSCPGGRVGNFEGSLACE